jgi:uncharacterized repeat protein (TIGR01451 family)
MKFSTLGLPYRARALFRPDTTSRSSGNQFFRPRLEHLEDRRLLSVSQSSSASPAAIHVAATVTPDLTITKTDNAGGSSITPTTGNVIPGQLLIYTVVVSNTGLGGATGVTIGDPIPSDVISDTWTAANTGSATASGFSTSGSGSINQTGVSLPAGSAITYTITGTVSPAATGTFSNTASVIEADDDPTATDTDNIANLSITKVDNAGGSSITPTTGSVTAGHSLTYTVVVGNTGPGSATGATIADPIPADFTSDTWTAASTGSVAASGFSASGSGSINQTGVNLPANSAITYTITGTINSTATGTLSNTATVTPSAGTAKSATDNDHLVTPAPSSLSGYAYVDANQNHNKDPGEPGIPNVAVMLTGTTSSSTPVSLSTTTDSTGFYSFANLAAGTYTITETQPTNFIEGKNDDQVGSQNSGTIAQTSTTNAVQNITLTAGVSGTGNNFGNVGESLSSVSKRSFLDPPPVLTITKVDNAGGSSITNTTGNVTQGQSLTYTIVVGNAGMGPVTEATIADSMLSTNFSSDTWTATSTGGATGFSNSGSGNIDDTSVTLPVGSSITYVVTGTVSSTATGTLSNTANVTPLGGSTESATDNDNLPALSITKVDNAGGSSITDITGNVTPGQSLTYSVVVSNPGPGNITGATIADPIPPDLTGDTWTAASTGSGTATGFATSGTGNINQTGVNLPADSAITYTITGTVLSTATGTFSNTATVTPPVGAPQTATDNDNLANLSITKVDNAGGSSITPSTGNVNPGQTLTYTIVVSNSGPGNETGATITDPIPSDLTGDTWTAANTGSATATGFATSGTGNINQTGVNLPAGSAITYVVTGTVVVPVGAVPVTGISNTATVTPSAGTPKTATDNDNLTDLSITKVDNAGGSSITPSTGNVNPGQTLTYTVVVSNGGPGNVTGATITDPIPADLTGDTWTAASTGSATATGFATSGSGNINQTGVNLPADSAITYTITGTVLATATGTMTNTATVAPPAGTSMSATDNDNLTDPSITKVDNVGGSSITPSTGNALQGQSLIYTVVVSNAGPGNITGATIADPIPADVTGVTWIAASTGSATATGFATSGTGNINQTGVNLPADSAITYTITGTVSATATGSFSNTATVTPPVGTPKTATDTDNLPDLSITKVDDAGGSSITPSTGNVTNGQTLTYTITVSNTGPGNVSGVSVSDPLPVELMTASYTTTLNGGATDSTPNGTGITALADTVSLPAHSSIVYTVTGTLDIPFNSDQPINSITNTVGETSPDGTTMTATDTDNVFRLVIGKGDNAGGSSVTPTTGSVAPGQTLIYTVAVGNAGPGTVTGAVITDSTLTTVFPGGDTWTASSPTTPPATGFTASGTGNITDTATLPPDSAVVYTITGTVSANAAVPSTLSNTATVTPPGAPGLNATDTDTVGIPDLTITKVDDAGGSSITPSTGNVIPGQTLVYTVVVGNTGGGVVGATIADPIPADLTGDTWTAASTGTVAATGFTGSGSGNINDTSVNLPANSAITYTITGTVPSAATGSFSNTATVTPPVGSAVSATDNDNLVDLSIIKSDDDDTNGTSNLQTASSHPAGTTGTGDETTETLHYTIVVSNAGPGNLGLASITDFFPAGYSEVSWTSNATGGAFGNSSNSTAGTSIDDTTVFLPAGSSITYVVTGSPNAGGTLSNTATITPPVGTAVPATDVDNVTIKPPAVVIFSTPAASPTVTPSNTSPGPAASGSTTLNVAAVDAALAGTGRHAWGPHQEPALLDAAVAGGTHGSSSTKTPSTSSFAALADTALLSLHEPLRHRFH